MMSRPAPLANLLCLQRLRAAGSATATNALTLHRGAISVKALSMCFVLPPHAHRHS